MLINENGLPEHDNLSNLRTLYAASSSPCVTVPKELFEEPFLNKKNFLSKPKIGEIQPMINIPSKDSVLYQTLSQADAMDILESASIAISISQLKNKNHLLNKKGSSKL